MNQYTFNITALHQINRHGHYVPEGLLFSSTIWADKTIDRYAFAQQLFDFWKTSQLLGSEQAEWLYQWSIEQV